MPLEPEETLANHLNDPLVAVGFRRIVPTPHVEAVRLIAAWKATWPRRGIAVVSIGKYIDHPGEFAAKIRKRVGRSIGYFPILMPLGLHLVITGSGILNRATELQLYLDTVATFGVTLLSVHVVDLVATPHLQGLPALPERHVEEIETLTQKNIGQVKNAMQPKLIDIFPATGDNNIQLVFNYSHRTGRAVKSACTWGRGGTLRPVFEAIGAGIVSYIHGG